MGDVLVFYGMLFLVFGGGALALALIIPPFAFAVKWWWDFWLRMGEKRGW